MGIEAINGVSSYMTSAVSAVSMGSGALSEETIKKLKQLGIDPTQVKSESEAQAIINQASGKQNNQQTQQVQPQQKTMSVDMKTLNDDIKALGDKLGVDVKTLGSLDNIVNRFQVLTNEYVLASSAQTNHAQKSANPFAVGNTQQNQKISTGVEVKENADDILSQYKSIKDRVDTINAEKQSMFAGQDMMSTLNKYALGL